MVAADHGLPFGKLTSMASLEEQRRYMIGATKNNYLLPEELLHDASDFCRMTRLDRLAPTVTAPQRAAVEALEAALDAHDDSWMSNYADMALDDLVERDSRWIQTRIQAGRVLAAFGQPVPP